MTDKEKKAIEILKADQNIEIPLKSDNLSICETTNKLDYSMIREEISCEKEKEEQKTEPFITIFKSKPIQGIVLELIGRNFEYKI